MNDGKICVSVCASTADELIAKVRQAEELADVIEVRFDCLQAEQLGGGLESLRSAKPLLATFRSAEQGGKTNASVEERLDLWSKNGDWWAIDVEEDILDKVATSGRKIASFHDFHGVPADIESLFERLTASDADIVKIAVTAADITETFALWKLLTKAKDAGKELIPIAMGEAGMWTRILGLAHGAFMTYASLGSGDETAPGQVTAKDLVELYRVKTITPETKVLGILGDPVSQSLSKFMHNPAFVAAGFDGVFIPFLVGNIDDFMIRMVRPETREVELNFGGFSVTMPHKQTIMKYLDEIDPTAARIGAVNTVKIDDGKLTGFNTDAHGFITPLISRLGDLKGARAAVFGAGGAARACVYALQQEGVDVEVFVRNIDKAKAFADEFGVRLSRIDAARGGMLHADILVDTTPIGMSGTDKTLFTSDELKGVKFVYDLVTKPYDTPIIQEAKKANIPAIGGMEMLVAQGARQFELWTGKSAPAEQMKASVLARFAELNK